MGNQTNQELIAAVLTLSEGIDALHEILRKTLSFNVDIEGNKIHQSFIPQPLPDTRSRFHQWQGAAKEEQAKES